MGDERTFARLVPFRLARLYADTSQAAGAGARMVRSSDVERLEEC
jgi:hypothetical protein